YELSQSDEQELLSGSKDIEIRPAVPYSLPRGANDADRLAEATGAVSASLDLDVALEKVAEQTAHLLQLESAAVFLFNEDADNLIFRYWSKDDQAWAKNFYKLGDFLDQAKAISLVRERGEPVFIDNVHESDLLPAELVSQLKVQAIALLPLVTARGVIGFISAPRRHPYRWELSDVRLALALVTPSATAIEYARLFNILQQHNSRTEVLNTMSQLFNTLPDPNQRLELILNRIMEIMGLDAGLILLIDQDTGGLKVVAHSGLSTNATLDLTEPPLQQFHKLACMVTALGEPLRLDGKNPTIQDLYAPLCAAGFCDMMAVPLMVSNTIFGVWLVGSRTMRTEEDLTLFSTIGQQLGLTLKNAYLLRSTSEMEALREADRLKSGFIATVSHDLRSPLTAIRASVESLLDRKVIQSTNEQEHLLHNIADQAGRLGRLVDQLLDLSRIEAGALPLDRDWTELPVLIADTVTKFEALNNGFKVECDLSARLPLHYVDPDRLVQVMWNLLENASKYASPSDPIRLDTFWTGAEVLIRIADRGPGIPTGEREKVFQHFYRLDRDRRSHTQGSGLGLAICRGIVQAHGGRIWVEDRPGGGSVFCIALPLPPPDPIVLEGLEENDLYPLSVKEK
ncbi:MAG TPA: ATP-binding protein, partial [Ktedonobacteraceae bacterium]|nr:ATP-binding protein [Ktedonobacteraceae bacterium]